MERNDLGERLLNFAVRIIKLVEVMPNSIAGRRIGDQLLRSGAPPGVNYEEAQSAESHADFTHKLQIALKETRETNYWLRVIHRTELLTQNHLGNLVDESEQLKKILSKAVATAKGKAKDKN